MIQPINAATNKNISFKQNNQKAQKASLSTKIASSAGSIIGITGALAIIAKKRGLKIENLFKSTNKSGIKVLADTFKKMEFSDKNVIALASSSILGGFLGGAITDSKNKKAKAKEGIVQLVGNYIVPSLFVGAGIKLNKALNNKYKFPPITKPIQFAFGFVSLILGVNVGNKISKEINIKVFKEEHYRELNAKDWAAQFDNACLVTSMSSVGTNLSKIASKIIPVAHIVPGYIVGTQRDKVEV